MHFVVLIQVPFVNPVDDGDDEHEHQQQVGYLEHIVGIERPDVQQHHQLELYREDRPAQQFVKAGLTVSPPPAILAQQLLSLPVEESMPNVKETYKHSHQHES